MGVSLEDGAIGYHPGGVIAVANLEYFYPPNKDSNVTNTPEWSEQAVTAKLYADISLSYTETIAPDLGPEDEYQLQDFGTSWRYNVCLATPHAEFQILLEG